MQCISRQQNERKPKRLKIWVLSRCKAVLVSLIWVGSAKRQEALNSSPAHHQHRGKSTQRAKLDSWPEGQFIRSHASLPPCSGGWLFHQSESKGLVKSEPQSAPILLRAFFKGCEVKRSPFVPWPTHNVTPKSEKTWPPRESVAMDRNIKLWQEPEWQILNLMTAMTNCLIAKTPNVSKFYIIGFLAAFFQD